MSVVLIASLLSIHVTYLASGLLLRPGCHGVDDRRMAADADPDDAFADSASDEFRVGAHAWHRQFSPSSAFDGDSRIFDPSEPIHAWWSHCDVLVAASISRSLA